MFIILLSLIALILMVRYSNIFYVGFLIYFDKCQKDNEKTVRESDRCTSHFVAVSSNVFLPCSGSIARYSFLQNALLLSVNVFL